MLIGNQSVINKSHARFYNPPVTTGSATTGVRYAGGRYAFFHPSLQKSRTIYWSENQSRPDGYGVGLAIFPALKSGGISSFTRIEGSGALTASAISARLSLAELTGDGALTADLSALVQAAAALAGSGSITQAEMQAVSALAAALAGSSSITEANLSSIVPMEAAISGTGTVANTTNLTGRGSLSASIEIGASDPLSAAGLATYLLDTSEIETNFSMRESLRLILSLLAGKVSGAGTSTISIRDVNDTIDRIVATVDANGNRTAVTKDVT